MLSETALALDRDKTLQTAQEFVDRKRYDRALVEYEKVIQADPNDTRTLLKIGDVQARSANFSLAIKTYDRVANYYSEQGFSLKAIAVYKQVRELIQRHAPAEAERYSHVVGRLVANYTELGLLNDALSTLDEEANRLRAAAREDEAIAVYRRMTEIGGGVPIAHLRLAEGLCRANEIAVAMTSFWTAAQLLIQGGRKDDALRVIERMLHFKQEPTYAKLAARLYLQKGTEAEGMVALSRLQLCFQADPHDLETLELLAEAFSLIGQEPKALEVKKEIAQQAHQQGDLPRFRAALNGLLEVAPEDEQVHALQKLALEKPEGGSHPRGGSTSAARALGAVPTGSPPPPPIGLEGGLEPEVDSAGAFETRSPSSLSMEIELLEDLGTEELGPASLAVPQPPRARMESDDLAEVRAHTRKALVDAETFRELNLREKAVETIQVALELDPRSIELREMLRDLYAESGDRDGAIDEMLTMAAIYMEYDRTDHARTVLENILEAEPGHGTATQMLFQLDSGLAQAEDLEPHAEEPRPHTEEPRPSDRPTPIEDLEVRAQIAPEALLEDADDFDLSDLQTASPSERAPTTSAALPPSMPASYAEALAIEAPPPAPRANGILPSFEIEAGSRTLQTLEEALEEAEFFIARGLYEDARLVLEEQLELTPDHPLLLDTLSEIESLEQAGAEPGLLGAGAGMPPELNDGEFNLQRSLDELERVVRESQSPPAAGGAVDVESVFEKFKAGVKRRVAENDSATHFELGVAYKQMNLLDDAVLEFELAAKDDLRECACYAMIGSIYVEHELWAEASKALSRALNAQKRSSEQETSLYYDLGHAAEKSGDAEQAANYFQQALARNPQYRDARQRLERAQEAARRSLAPKADADDDLDRAFDELLGD